MIKGDPPGHIEPSAHRLEKGWSANELVRLRDGSRVAIREVVPGDEAGLHTFLSGLSPRSRQLRYFGAGVDLGQAAHAATESGPGRCGLLVHDEIGVVVGHAFYVRLDDSCAEVAVEVADRLHGDGLGTILVERLAAIAEMRGISRFVAVVQADNRAMLDVFRDGFDGRVVGRAGPEERVEFLTSGWRQAEARVLGCVDADA